MRINKNIYSLNIYNNYKKSIASNSTALERISSGLKINSAKDNPIKIERCESLNLKIRSLEMANRNLQDSVSMIQAADASMATINEALIRMKELVVQAGNGAYTETEKEVIQVELDELKEYITKAAEQTEFNGNKLISGNGAGEFKKVQIGTEVGESMDIPLFDISADTLGIKDIDIKDEDALGDSLSAVEQAISTMSGYRSKYGALQNRIESSMDIVSETSANLVDANSLLTDADLALEMVEYSRSDVLVQSAIALMAQSNNFPKDVLNILSGLIK